MNKINRLKIGGFRRLHAIDLPVRPLMVLIGANGVGKTSLLDALSLLSASAAGELTGKLSELGGLASITTRSTDTSELSLLVDMEVPGYEPLEYQISVAPKGAGYSISKEILSQGRGRPIPFKHIDSRGGEIRYYRTDGPRGLVRPDWDHNPLESSLSQVPKMFREPEELRRVLASASLYHVLDVGVRAPVKLPQQMKPATLPGPDGSELVPYLYYLRESDSGRFDAIVDSLKAAFRDFEGLSFPPVAAGLLTMTWKERGFPKPFYMHELSEGTLRFLWLASLLQSPGLSTITMIDEPEVSLHPELLSLLADLMREAVRHTLLVVATHSDRLIRFLRPEEVVVMDVGGDGAATATWADTMNLEAWLNEYGLDEVWRMGRMGGRS
ncbi:MAG: AAA family ATPase [Candidatus Riflebacteria bacterium]|nr:AAA family ATPase [Candidatus Riflebacteria bacterium]